MKRLILIRHAKSSWSEPGLSDRDRPLNARGRTAAEKIGRWLADNGHAPGQVLSSPARRCRETWERIAAQLNAPPEPELIDRLYLADPDEMLATLKAAAEGSVVMLGHMPGIGEFARALRRDPPPRHDIFRKYPTGGMLILDFAADSWESILPGTGRLVAWITPRTL